jgi:N6-adenosine-specific RNA methylase IME4
VLKADVHQYIEGDQEMIDLVTRMVYQEQVVSLLEDIMRSINNRGFQIKNAIDWRKLTNFGV